MKIQIIAFGILSMFAVSACEPRNHEGPAERAGRHIDNAVEDVHDAGERAEHEIKEESREAKNRIRHDDDRSDDRERD